MKCFRHKCRWAALVTALLLMFTGSAFARYSTLEFGDRGKDVLKLQMTLQTLGYDPQGTDGKFGRGTENAVKLFQSKNGLEADGKAGHLTLSLLYEGSGVVANDGSQIAGNAGSTGSSSDDVPVSNATSTNPNTLKYGDTGARVTELQTSLKQLGYDPNGVDGKFGVGTQRAVVKFQKANGLKADGLAGTKTLELIRQKVAALGGSTSGGSSTNNSTSGSSSGTVSGIAGLTRTLRKGYTGSDVRTVQQRLQELGYYTNTVDGVYGTGSIAAVRAFQQANGLTADGLAGTRTFQVLFSASAVAAGKPSTTTPESTQPPATETPAPEESKPTTGYETLRYGAKGDAVRNLQKALKSLGYSVSTDGDYGALTQKAVKNFQKVNGLEADGVAGPGTQELLYSGNAKKYDAEAAGETNTLPEGVGTASGPSTSSVKLLHWFNDIKPTIRTGQAVTVFDPATNLQWKLRFYSLGRHADSEPLTATDTQIMFKAFGNTNTWTPKPVYVQLPSGVWTLASMHNVPHLSGSIKDNDFDGHLCVHFLRDMDEAAKNDPNYGVQNQNAIRKKWKQMTGETVE